MKGEMEEMIVQPVDKVHFEKSTKLKLNPDLSNPTRFIECSGKKFETIRNRIIVYNNMYDARVFCYNDFTKDCTYILL